ncbi:hypothetical protein ACSBR1_002346 [Camellia fascicularis]
MESSEIEVIHQSDFEVHLSDSDLEIEIVIQISAIQIGLSDSYLEIEIEVRFRSSFRSQRFRSISVIHISKSKSKVISAIQIGDSTW